MTRRVYTDDRGIWLDIPDGTSGFPWAEITSAKLYVDDWPEGEPEALDLDVTDSSGKHLHTGSFDEGFREAVADVAARGIALDLPFLMMLCPWGHLELWRVEKSGEL